ncbi:hypothetical protein GCM10011273_20350 [Asticcacaulis endophyticus]|uniref:Uncharacterized protein n=1 Tax=Asticcacaulis endophyticus TaxID=1395890 RepID=A0A918Q7K4_9CAUL|nr:hypothetical protein GCM10011273_20350 [Asticcacaulis endophyticus]
MRALCRRLAGDCGNYTASQWNWDKILWLREQVFKAGDKSENSPKISTCYGGVSPYTPRLSKNAVKDTAAHGYIAASRNYHGVSLGLAGHEARG